MIKHILEATDTDGTNLTPWIIGTEITGVICIAAALYCIHNID